MSEIVREFTSENLQRREELWQRLKVIEKEADDVRVEIKTIDDAAPVRILDFR